MEEGAKVEVVDEFIQAVRTNSEKLKVGAQFYFQEDNKFLDYPDYNE